MTAGALSGDLSVLVVGALACVAPVASRPTLQFGVRVPPEQAGAPVIRRERRAYLWRTAGIGACCTVAALALQGHESWWLPRIILLLELAADFGCFWVARRQIGAVKQADGWFAGLRQTVATDTSWRTNPPRFPVRWLIPALAVIAATAAVGALRYPGLPAHLVTGSGHRAPKSAVIVLVVAFQLYVTVLWIGLMLIIYRSRPDIEAADPAMSTLRYRRFLAATTRALLTLLALVDTSLLLIALRSWQVYQPSGIGRALPALPFVAGLILLATVARRAGQGGWRLNGNVRGLARATGTDRDDDRFWKAGLLYVNRDDPALVVGSHVGAGWSLNLGNPAAWLIIAGNIAALAGLVTIGMVAPSPVKPGGASQSTTLREWQWRSSSTRCTWHLRSWWYPTISPRARTGRCGRRPLQRSSTVNGTRSWWIRS
jgi:uncharacterized membrane protein